MQNFFSFTQLNIKRVASLFCVKKIHATLVVDLNSYRFDKMLAITVNNFASLIDMLVMF